MKTSIKKLLFLIILISTPLAFADKGKETKAHHHDEAHSDQHAHGKDHEHSKTSAEVRKVGKSEMLVKVKGMVCAFCAQGIEKNFNAREEVKSTKVDLDKMEVKVTFHKGKSLSTKVVKEIVTGAGFQFAGVAE